MKEIEAVLLRDSYKIEAGKSTLLPFSDKHSLVKVRDVLITPNNLLTVSRGRLGLLFGVEVDRGANVVFSKFCAEHDHYEKEIVAWKITPCDKAFLTKPPSHIEEPILYPIFSTVVDAVENSWGETLVISKGGLSYYLYSVLSNRPHFLYGGLSSPFLKKEPTISAEKLKESSWDTVIILTLHRELVIEALNMIEDVKRVLVSPMFQCQSRIIPVNCYNCAIRILSSMKDVDAGYIRVINTGKLSKYLERIRISDLPAVVNKPYTIVRLEE